MNEVLLLAGIVIMICILLGRFAESLPVPSLLIFIGLGMFFGVNGPIGIQFDDYSVSESICTACLIFIMFYGGFGTNIASAKPVLGKSYLSFYIGGYPHRRPYRSFYTFRAHHLSWTEKYSDRKRHRFNRCGFGLQHSPFPEPGAKRQYGSLF